MGGIHKWNQSSWWKVEEFCQFLPKNWRKQRYDKGKQPVTETVEQWT